MIRSSLLTSLGFGLTFSATLLVAAAGLAPDTLVPGDVGDPAIDGVTTNRADAIEIVAAGMGIGFKADQFHFAAASEVGDFDVRVRVSVLKPTDLWAKAGLMLRANRTAGAPFAGVFVTPSGVGCLFQSRDTDSANAANQGFFPANQPFAWLRIRRVGDELTGYAGYDGRRWTELGSRSVAWGTNALLGLAVTSHSTKATTAEFHELGAVTDGVEKEVPVPIEPLGPSSRRSSLVISMKNNSEATKEQTPQTQPRGSKAKPTKATAARIATEAQLIAQAAKFADDEVPASEPSKPDTAPKAKKVKAPKPPKAARRF